jgi:hypothetical protein
VLPDLFRRLKPLYGVVMDLLWIEYQTADPVRRREIEEVLVLIAVQRLGIRLGDERIVLEPPRASVIGQGEVLLGNVVYPGMAPIPVRVGRNELLRHLFLLGPTGTGKSTFILQVVTQLLAADVPCWLFDFKRNYRCLLSASVGRKVLVVTLARDIAPFRVNVLRAPPGVLVAEWIEALADIMSTAYLLMQGARNVLKDVFLRVCEVHGPVATLLHAYRLLREDLRQTRLGSRRHGWMESAARTLEELSSGPFGSTLIIGEARAFSSLLEHAVVFEAQSLGDDQKRFFCLYAMQYVLLLRKHADDRREVLQHVLVFDESHHVFPKDKYGELGVPSRLAREIREYGEAIVAASQQSDISDSVIANAGFKVVLRCDFPRDVEFASKLMQVDPRWVSKLSMGQALVRFPVRSYQPFLLAFPEQPLKNTHVADAQVAAQYQDIVQRAVPAVARSSEKDDALLRDIAAHPISGITTRYARLGWNPYTGNAVTRRVLARHLAVFSPVVTPTARVKILTLTVDGRVHLHEQGVVVAPKAKGGVEHEYWRHILRERLLKKGYTVHEEYPVENSQAVDLYAEKPGRILYIEVETGKSDIAANINKCKALNGIVVFFLIAPAVSAIPLPANMLRLTPVDLERGDPF